LTALVFIWNHIFLNVADFFAKGSCFGSAILGHMQRVPIFSCSSTAAVAVAGEARFSEAFLRIFEEKKAGVLELVIECRSY
jgi:hypothetical protein